MKGTNHNGAHWVGQPVERLEDARLLTGRGCFIDDLNLTGQWHAAIVRSSVAHGQISHLDCAAARALPGVRAVFTATDIGAPLPRIPFRRPIAALAPFAQPIIASERVRYVGEPVAIVIADAAALAEDAAQRVELEIEPLQAVTQMPCAGGTDVPLLFAATQTNCAMVFKARQGAVDAAFSAAAHVQSDRFRVQRMTAAPMETRGLIARWDSARAHLTMHGAAKVSWFNRRSLAALMNLDETAVDYIEYDVGGGFGARGEFYPEDFLLAFAARRLDRPIKWVEDRREHFMATGHSRETEADVSMAFDATGRILAVRGALHVDIGAYVRPNGMTPVRNAAQFLTGPYQIEAIELDAHAWVSNKTPAGTLRGPGRFESCFVCERLIDMAATALGLDAADIRRRNLIAPDRMPWALAPVLPNDGFGETACDSGHYSAAFDRCLSIAGWSEKQSLQGQLIAGRRHGLGIACFIEGGASGPRESARAEIDGQGQIIIHVGSSSVGQGVETIFSQIAADELGVTPAAIRIVHGSTDVLPEGFGSYGSRATVMGGNAVLLAARQLRAALDATRPGTPIEPIVVSFANSKQTYTYGTAVAHVAVDEQTGRVDLIDYRVVDDVGRIINPLTLHGQVVGAAVQGLGGVFTEELVYDEHGQLLTGSMADYLTPVATDYPQVAAESLEDHPSPNNPLGAKGAGEGGTIPVGAAVANALAAALRARAVQPRVLPLSPQRVWELVNQGTIGVG